MDRVRFGRALGYGARHAAKTVMRAVEAAAAPSPEAAQRGGQLGARPAASPTLQEAAKVAGKSVFAPLARFSGVLWLEVTGTFFALIALFLSQSVWKLRAGFRLPPTSPDALRLYLYTLIFFAFAYFAVSSFVRARRKERRR